MILTIIFWKTKPMEALKRVEIAGTSRRERKSVLGQGN